MTLRRITVERIALNLEGLPVAQAELLAAQLPAALAAQAFAPTPDGEAQRGEELRTDLTSQALVTAVAARLAGLLASAAEAPPWP